MNNPHNLYIHVPFCVSKCKYCAFFSHACSNPDWERYSNDICHELMFWSKKIGKISVPTVFFGGGTPSLMNMDCFEKIMKCIHDNFDVMSDCEITLESNPGTINSDKLKDFVSNGVNRLSVGVQSFDDAELKFLGRIHNANQAIELLDCAIGMGLNVSADFIYALPHHTEENIKKLCGQINNVGLKHVSLYELTIEENTPFGKMNLKMPDNEMMAKMYETIPQYLSLQRYEVSNYALKGFECKHNTNIWNGDAYIGIGRGGAGRVFIDGKWFDELGNFERFERISETQRAFEKILTGMRTMRGVRLANDVKNILNTDWINEHKNLVEIDGDYLHTLPDGLLMLDNIVSDLIK